MVIQERGLQEVGEFLESKIKQLKGLQGKTFEKRGLCHSELMKLKKLWESANKIQKKAILESVTTISQFVKKVPNEAGVGLPSSEWSFSDQKRNKLEDSHVKSTFP